jgi:putative transposase
VGAALSSPSPRRRITTCPAAGGKATFSKLAEGEKLLGQGHSIEEMARHLEITESTQHRWRNQYGGVQATDAKRSKELEKENQRLKRIVADQALDIDTV